jgi:hypothetical protein
MNHPSAPISEDAPGELAPSWTIGVDLGLSAAIWTWLITGPLLSLIASPLIQAFARPESYNAWLGLILTAGCALPGALVGLLTAFGNYRLALEQYRRKNGRCVRCGYDLRAAEDRCPECGRRIEAPRVGSFWVWADRYPARDETHHACSLYVLPVPWGG